MQNLQQLLKQKLECASRIVFLGVGSDLRGDDAAGLLLSNLLREHFDAAPKGGSCTVTVIIGGTAPENVTADIKRFKPTHLVILDAGDMGKEPGAAGVFSTADMHGVSFSTHRLPLTMLVEYLGQFGRFETILLAIQPTSLAFGESVSPAVKAAVATAFAAVKEALPA